MTKKDNEIQKKIRQRIVNGNHEGYSGKLQGMNDAKMGIKLLQYTTIAIIVASFIWAFFL